MHFFCHDLASPIKYCDNNRKNTYFYGNSNIFLLKPPSWQGRMLTAPPL